ncbi:MAG TPA: protein kinase [Kineosporiaceae bacterium]|nr:protein kinase [Kineosporiaceae bacterium]
MDDGHAEERQLRHSERLHSARIGGTGGRPMITAGAPPAVPGLLLDRRLGTGEYGEVWSALDLGAVRTVAVQLGRPAGGTGAAAREAALLRRVDHENVARFRSVLDLPDGRRAVVLDLVPGGDLADLAGLVARRGPLPTGEVVTVAVALARALDHVHASGFVHGRLTAHDVLFAADGRPVLTGVGIPSLLAPVTSRPPSYPAPADDVRALGEVLRHALTGGRADTEVPGPLAPLVALCLAEDPGSRPAPARVATLAWDAGPALPVGLGESGPLVPVPAPHEPDAGERRRAPGRRGVLATSLAALVVGSSAVALHDGDDPPRATGLEDARTLVSRLATARARALGALSEPALADVDAPGSPALTVDTAFIARLRHAGLRLRGLGFEVTGAAVGETAGDTATVRATVVTSAHEQVRGDGSVVRSVPRGMSRTVRLTLVRTGSGWRISADG